MYPKLGNTKSRSCDQDIWRKQDRLSGVRVPYDNSWLLKSIKDLFQNQFVFASQKVKKTQWLVSFMLHVLYKWSWSAQLDRRVFVRGSLSDWNMTEYMFGSEIH